MRTFRSSGRLSRGGGVCSWGVASQHALRQTPPCGQTDACKNITFATSLRTVKIEAFKNVHIHNGKFSYFRLIDFFYIFMDSDNWFFVRVFREGIYE